MRSRFCDGLTRRDCLRLGTAAAFGLPFTLPTILRADALKPKPAKEISLLYLFLRGGLSTIDTLDLKPDAPAEFRGEFKPINTNVPGIQVGEHLPKLAKHADQFSLVRSFRHHNSDHGASDHYMLTGWFPGPGFNPNLSPNNDRPAFGAVTSKALGPRGAVPAYVCLPRMHPSSGSAHLGAAHAPFVIENDPSAPNFSVPDLAPPPVVATDRVDDRRKLLAEVDRYQKANEAKVNRMPKTVGVFREKAFELMTSPAAKKAFDIGSEPDKIRDEYGRTSLGQSCLLGRRMIEAGVRCVTIDHANWDTHDGNFATLKNALLPQLDMAVPTLLRDLADRGLLDSTLVVISGEFGRTPRINPNAGRDHWGPGFTVMLAGGGIKPGRVIGKSDARAERPASDPYGPEDLAATMFTLLGVDPKTEFHTPDGRPIPIVNNGKVIAPLL